MPPDLRLIATDLDGTITGDSSELPLYTELRKRIDHLRARHESVWAVCTGRSLNSFREATEAMEAVGLMPDFVILRHAYVYERRRLGYRPHVGWNLRIRLHLFLSSLNIRGAIKEWHRLVLGITPHVTTIHRRSNRLCLRFEKDADCNQACTLLQEKAREFRYLVVFRYLQEIDVRMVPFTKGLALQDLAARLGIGPEEMLAVGNGHNDISMLDGRIARHTGCPGNAEVSVMQTVHKAGGHVSRQHILAGTIDVLDAYLEDRVDSSLPDWWKDASDTRNPRTRGWHSRPPRPPVKDKKKRRGIILVILIIYALLTVFASFEILPFSDFIMLPFTWLGRLFEHIL